MLLNEALDLGSPKSDMPSHPDMRDERLGAVNVIVDPPRRHAEKFSDLLHIEQQSLNSRLFCALSPALVHSRILTHKGLIVNS